MEWLMMNAYGANTFGENLGYYLADSYIVAEECEDTLQEMVQQLQMEDPIKRQFRRQLALMEVIQKDLVPLLIHLDFEENPAAFYLLMHALADLSQPSECLQEMLPHDQWWKPQQSGHKIQELSKLLYDIKQAFLSEDIIKRLFEGIIMIAQQEGPLAHEQCQAVIHFFYLIRNLLHTEEDNQDSDSKELPSNHFLRLRNLLFCGLGDILITFLALPQWDLFSGVVVQLLSVLFKELVPIQPSKNGSTLEGIPCQDSMLDSGSTENVCFDKPNNCQGQGQTEFEEDKGPPGESLERIHLSSLPELVDVIHCMENLFSESDKTLEAEPSEECPSSSTPCLNIPLLPSHTVSEETARLITEIRSLLSDFTTIFIEKAFTQIVLSLLNHNATSKNSVDEMYFTWMVAYFLTFARKKKMNFNCVRVVFLHEVVGMIVFQGLKTWTNILQLGESCPVNRTSSLRRFHLVVTALKEIFKCLRMYSHDPNIPEEGRTALRMIKYNLSSMTDLRQFLVLTLRSYKSESANLSFLRDLIKTNHLLMQVLDESLHLGINPSFQMLAHVQQFGSKDIMHNFGKLLANFENNSPSLNTAILTMMHHVSGDCGKVSSLIQLSVISTFVKLCDTKYPMSVEVNDLIEYVFKTFINRMWSDPQKLAQDIFCEFSEYDEFTEEEKDLTISLYMESVDGSDLVKTVRQKLEQNGVQKSQKEISEFLTSCGFEVDQLDEDKKEDEIQFSENDGSLEAYDCTLVKNHVDKIQEAGMKSALKWIQSSLLEVCFSKLVISGFKPTTLKQMWEPMSFYCTVKKTDVPLLPFNDEQESFCKDTKVRYLLSALQFRVPSHSQDYFYVPTTWGIKDLWDKAGILGQINPEELKFSIEDLESHLSMKQEITYVDAVNFDREIHAPNTGNMGTSNKMFWARAVSKINKNLSSLSSDSPSPMIS